VKFLKDVLAQVGIDPKRLRLEWVSASEGGKFARIVKEMIEDVRKLGPSPLRKEFQETVST